MSPPSPATGGVLRWRLGTADSSAEMENPAPATRV